VIENRKLYAEKFSVITPLLSGVLEVKKPDAAFYLWAKIKPSNGHQLSDTEFALTLYREFNVTVLPGSYLAREAHGINPGEHFVRLALVASLDECVDAANRIKKMMI
jgi:N-succinyldiaminopimelate aminotransferase